MGQETFHKPVKYLLDECLQWNFHMNQLCLKLNKANKMLCKILYYANGTTLRSIYYAIFFSLTLMNIPLLYFQMQKF